MKTAERSAAIGQQRQFCTFRVDQNLFGVNITDVKEVRTPDRFTRVFHASEDVRGFVNVRGQIHLVIDLRVLVGFESAVIGRLSRIVLFKPHVGESFGILVDAIGDVVETDETRIENMGDGNRDTEDGGMRELSDMITGNYKLDDKIVIILDSTLLLKKIKGKHE